MKQRRNFDKAFKEEAVALLESSDKTIKEVAEELGIDRSSLAYWRREKLLHQEKAPGLTAHPGAAGTGHRRNPDPAAAPLAVWGKVNNERITEDLGPDR